MNSGEPPDLNTLKSADPRARRRPSPKRVRSALLPAIRVTREERDQILAVAILRGITVAELVRRSVLGRRLPPPIPRVNLEVWAQLGPLAASFNELVRAGEEGRTEAALLPLLEELRHLLTELREALRGGLAGPTGRPEERGAGAVEP